MKKLLVHDQEKCEAIKSVAPKTNYYIFKKEKYFSKASYVYQSHKTVKKILWF